MIPLVKGGQEALHRVSWTQVLKNGMSACGETDETDKDLCLVKVSFLFVVSLMPSCCSSPLFPKTVSSSSCFSPPDVFPSTSSYASILSINPWFLNFPLTRHCRVNLRNQKGNLKPVLLLFRNNPKLRGVTARELARSTVSFQQFSSQAWRYEDFTAEDNTSPDWKGKLFCSSPSCCFSIKNVLQWYLVNKKKLL